jgi:hypothetical protein
VAERPSDVHEGGLKMANKIRRKINENQAKNLIEAFLNGRISVKELVDRIIENAEGDDKPSRPTVYRLERR